MFKMYLIYVQPKHVCIMFTKFLEHVQIFFIRDQKENKKFWEGENIP